MHVKNCCRGRQFTKSCLGKIKGKPKICLGLPILVDFGIFDSVRESGNIPLCLHYVAKQ